MARKKKKAKRQSVSTETPMPGQQEQYDAGQDRGVSAADIKPAGAQNFANTNENDERGLSAADIKPD